MLGLVYNGFHKNQYQFPLSFGLFFDPAPAINGQDDYYGLTIGSGVMKKNSLKTNKYNFSIDFAYQYRFGNNINQSILKHWRFSQDIHEHTFDVTFIKYF